MSTDRKYVRDHLHKLKTQRLLKDTSFASGTSGETVLLKMLEAVDRVERRPGKAKRGHKSELRQVIERACQEIREPTLKAILDHLDDGDTIEDLFESNENAIDAHGFEVIPEGWRNMTSELLREEGRLNFTTRKNKHRSVSLKRVSNLIGICKKNANH